MIERKGSKDSIGIAVTEYALILGIVSLVFISMNTYIKRGFQAKIADMSDYFIGREHAADSNPTAIVTSNSNTTSYSNVNTELFTGGGMKLALLDTTNINSTTRVVDNARSATNENYIPADRGYINVPVRPEEQEVYDKEGEETEANIKLLKAQRDRLLLEARILEEKARIIDSRGRQLISRANHMDCHGHKSCRRARRNLSRAGQNMVNQASKMRKEARDKREEADRIQDEIDELEG